MLQFFKRILLSLVIAAGASLSLAAQIAVSSVNTSATQAVIQFTSPVNQACSIQVADMNRAITIASVVQANGIVTVQTSSPHGLLAGQVIYLENSGGWNGWQTIATVPSPVTFTFASAATGSGAGGNVGVLVDDVNPALFAGGDQDSRPGNIATIQTVTGGQLQQHAQIEGRSRTFVIGKRTSDVGLDGNRYSRALQPYSRHHFTLTCGTQTFDQEFQTANLPTGDTHNEAPPVDRNHPGQYAYPNVQWNNPAQTLIDPLTGLRSKRATQPQDAAANNQNFVTAIDAQSAWQNPSAPLTNNGASASFTGPCPSGTCPLFLRTDNLTITGGATYQVGSTSLDWVKVNLGLASISGTCSGDDCKVDACLTVDGVDCAGGTIETPLSGLPANYVLGSGKLMDFWQASGTPPISRVDATTASGTVSYTAATKQVAYISGNVFNTRWTAGSSITIAGAPYTIASVQHERLLTLTNGPGSDVSGAPYSANNFGVLVWKKTGSANRISIGYTTYSYGTAGMPSWQAQELNPCSSPVTVNGVVGYNCFLGRELFWIAGDGSDTRDLGYIALSYYGAGEWPQGSLCGTSEQPAQFDPQNGDEWYCITYPYYQANRASIVQIHYTGAHTSYTPGAQLPDCANNHNQQPCIQVTLMQPNQTDSISATGPAFNPAFTSSGYVPQYYLMQGISSDGDFLVYTRLCCQDTIGWLLVYTLGDRTPTGTTANSVRIVAAASTYLQAPLSWCTIHALPNFSGGWAGVYSNNISIGGPAWTYTMTLTSPTLNTTVGAPGGFSACPPNPFGITTQTCTAITVNGEPANVANGTTPQNVQVGDLIVIDNEYMRVLAVNSPTSLVVQRGYMNQALSHNGTTLTMACGTLNPLSSRIGLWNYRADPYGTNANWNTIINDSDAPGGHNWVGDQLTISSSSIDALGETLCPREAGANCYEVRYGNLPTAQQSQLHSIVNAPPFAGKFGISTPNVVDSHPGPCAGSVCVDGRPMDGGGSNYPIAGATLGSKNSPYQLVSGQLWKLPAAQAALQRKYLTTGAYVGRFPLVDISGPASVIGTGAQDSYKYCIPVAAGECVSGSTPGDVYVNAPYVDFPYCYYPGIAIQGDDTNSICMFDLSGFTGNVVEFNVSNHDVVGTATRRLGPNYAKWNQNDVFWNAFTSPNTLVMGTQARWLDGVRFDDLMTTLPPFPDPDGVARNTFIPINVTIDPPSTLPVQTAVVEFGYAENGDPTGYYCTSRQEACVATGATVNISVPFTFEQSEGYTGQACSNGCTIAIPALSQRALYYRWKYLDANGQVLQVSQSHVTLTP